MTNEEYKELASKILNDVDNNEERLKQEENDIIYTIEVFLIKMKEAIATLDENTFPHCGVDLFKKILPPPNDEENDQSDDIGSLPPSDTTLCWLSYMQYTGIRLAVKNHADPEYMLSNMGVKNPHNLISQINKDIDDREELWDSICDICNQLESAIGIDKLMDIYLWGMASSYGKQIIKFCKSISQNNFLLILKEIEYIGKKYYQIYKERIPLIFFRLKEFISNRANNIENCIPEEILGLIIENYLNEYSFDKHTVDEVTCKCPNIMLDVFFLFYYYIYEKPQYIVKLGFTLMSGKSSAEIQSAIFLSFSSQDYAPLIQYEYEWWRKETGEILSLPFPFFKGTVNLQSINIVDYKLDSPKQIIEGLSDIDSESPDEDKDQHFGLSFKSETVKYLFDNIKGAYIDPDTDIRLFCYRLTGKGKLDKISYLKWIADEKSLAFFIRRLGVSKNNCWQKTEDFFGNKANNLKTIYSRLVDTKGCLKTNETNLKRLEQIIDEALSYIPHH